MPTKLVEAALIHEDVQIRGAVGDDAVHPEPMFDGRAGRREPDQVGLSSLVRVSAISVPLAPIGHFQR